MNFEARSKMFAEAIASGDDLLVGAVLSSHPALVGMGPEELEGRRKQWRRARHPDVAKRLERLSATARDLQTASAATIAFAEKLFAPATKVEAAALQVEAAVKAASASEAA
jgi:hypothetical protein